MNDQLFLTICGFIISLAAMLWILKTYWGRPVHFIQDAQGNVMAYAAISLAAIPVAVVIMLPYQIFSIIYHKLKENKNK